MYKNFRDKFSLARLLFCGALAFGCTPALVAQGVWHAPSARVLVTRPIDPGKLHTLAGNTRGEANPQNDRGKVAETFAMDHMLLQLQRSPEREQALKDFIDRQYDSTSPNFHRWLTAVEFGRMFGPAAEDIEAVTWWLHSSGFTVNTVYPSGMLIDFSGMAGRVSAAFHTEIHSLSVNGKSHIANMSDPRIPEALAPIVAGIVSLHDFRPHSMRKPRAQYTVSEFGSTYHLVAPADLATIYDLNPAFAAGYTGQGQTIAVLEDTDLYDTTDWGTFRSVLGLSGYTSGSLNTIQPAPPSGPSNCTDPGATPDDIEATLDAEWASAAAPNAAIDVAACQDTQTTFGVLIAEQNLINGSAPPQIVSVSYGECEAANGAAANAATNAAAQQAVTEGVSVFVAAGDEGAASCDAGFSVATHGIGISANASTPYNVAVGGTDFADTYLGSAKTYWSTLNSSTYGSALSYIPEIPWNDTCAGSILAVYSGYAFGYGSNGYCGSGAWQQLEQDLALEDDAEISAGSGGPSGCATGATAQNFVVGGSCQGYAKPSWQAGVSGIPNDGVRDIPDVSLFAATGIWGHYYVTCFSDPANGGVPCVGAPVNWGGAGGTSFASPIMAGIQALVNQKMGGAQGNPNPVYYSLAAGSVASSVFHGITKGDIAVNCAGEINCFGAGFEGRGRATPVTVFVGNGALSTTGQTYTPAFAAGSGWSFATGLGSVDAYNLILNWSNGQ
jgi:subtilase family serine protease